MFTVTANLYGNILSRVVDAFWIMIKALVVFLRIAFPEHAVNPLKRHHNVLFCMLNSQAGTNSSPSWARGALNEALTIRDQDGIGAFRHECCIAETR
jgi:hypothetical protein